MPDSGTKNISNQKEISAQIHDMLETLKKVSKGDLTARAKETGDNSEFDLLAQGINEAITTFQAHSQTQLLEQKLFFENILNKFPIEVVIFNPDFRYIFINPKAVKDDQTRAWLIGKTDYDYCQYKGSDESIAMERFELYLRVRKDKKPHSIQQSAVTEDGSQRHYLRILNPVMDEEDKVEMFIGYGFDITEIKNQENELRDKNDELVLTNKILDEYVYRSSHDLRAPLTSILGLINLLDLEVAPSSKEYLRLMERTVIKLDSFINSIVENSKNSRQNLSVERIEMPSLIEGTLQSLQFLDGFDKIRFEVKCHATAPFHSDGHRIKTLLNNLLSNSIKYHNYLQEQLFVHIDVLVDEDRAEITVTDNGMGIPSSSHGKLFDMFYRATHHAFGSGMGLYIVKETLDKMEGEVNFESVEGKGSTFRVNVPNLSTQ